MTTSSFAPVTSIARTGGGAPSILAVSSPGTGHLAALLPSLWAARLAGASVVVAAPGPDASAAAAAGFPSVDLTSHSPDAISLVRTNYLLQMQGTPPQHRFSLAMRMFADMADRIAAPLVELTHQLHPDVVIHTPLQPAGPVAAAVAKCPAVEHGFQLTGVLRTQHLMLPHLAEACSRAGVTHVPPPAAALDICPPSMHPGGPTAIPVGYRPFTGGRVLESSTFTQRGSRPRVLISVGTHHDRRSLLEAVVGSLRTLPVDLIIAGEGIDGAAGWVPFDPVLRTCAAIVHHGGAGSVLSALSFGVPQVIVDGEADHRFNAAAVQRRGAGVAAFLEEVGPAGVRTATERVLDEPEWSQASTEVAQEISRTPGPADVIPPLMGQLIGSH